MTRRPTGRAGGRPVRARPPGTVEAVAIAAPRAMGLSLHQRPRGNVRRVLWREGPVARIGTEIPAALKADLFALCVARQETLGRFVADAIRRHVTALAQED